MTPDETTLINQIKTRGYAVFIEPWGDRMLFMASCGDGAPITVYFKDESEQYQAICNAAKLAGITLPA